MRSDTILARAEFDSRLPKYFMLQSVVLLAFTFFGILLIPLWLLFGRSVHQRQYEALSAELTERSLNIRRGYLFKVQQNIPLDKITDLAVNEGPVLRVFGLCSLRVETAGGGSGSTMGQGSLIGVVDAIGFRDKVLEQRDRASGVVSAPVAPLPASGSAASGQEVLEEIRDTLHKIEGHLAQK